VRIDDNPGWAPIWYATTPFKHVTGPGTCEPHLAAWAASSVKLQRPDRDTVCSHSVMDATANAELILNKPRRLTLVKIALPSSTAVGLTKGARCPMRNSPVSG